VGGEFSKFVAQHHAEFGYPRFLSASFLNPYHGPGCIKCLFNGGNTSGSKQLHVEEPIVPPCLSGESLEALSHWAAGLRPSDGLYCAL
jgi:hypothetical protein